MTNESTPAALRLSDQLGPLPEAAMVETNPFGEPGTLEWYDAEQMRAYAAAAVAAERERCAKLCEAAPIIGRSDQEAFGFSNALETCAAAIRRA